jgi:hypothetical protein
MNALMTAQDVQEQPSARLRSDHDPVTIISHFYSNTGTKKSGATGIRTPDLLHEPQAIPLTCSYAA